MSQTNNCKYAGCKILGKPHIYRSEECLLHAIKGKACLNSVCIRMNITPHEMDSTQCIALKAELIKNSMDNIDSIDYLKANIKYYNDLLNLRSEGKVGSLYTDEKKQLFEILTRESHMFKANIINEIDEAIKKHMNEKKEVKYNKFTDIKGVDKTAFEKFCESGRKYAISLKLQYSHNENKGVKNVENENNGSKGNEAVRGRGRGRGRGGRGRGRGRGRCVISTEEKSDSTEDTSVEELDNNTKQLTELISNVSLVQVDK